MSERTDKAFSALRTLISLRIKPTELEISHEMFHELAETSLSTVTILSSEAHEIPKQYPHTFYGIPVKVVL